MFIPVVCEILLLAVCVIRCTISFKLFFACYKFLCLLKGSGYELILCGMHVIHCFLFKFLCYRKLKRIGEIEEVIVTY